MICVLCVCLYRLAALLSVALMLLAHWQSQSHRETGTAGPATVGGRMIRCFSLRDNFQYIRSTDRSSGDVPVLCGLRWSLAPHRIDKYTCTYYLLSTQLSFHMPFQIHRLHAYTSDTCGIIVDQYFAQFNSNACVQRNRSHGYNVYSR